MLRLFNHSFGERGNMHFKKITFITLLCSALAGCGMTLPLKGQTASGAETFSGKATGYVDGAGTIELTSSKGRKCTGTFVYVTKRNGEGTFTCQDGKSGDFKFVSTGLRGTGSGTIAGELFTFTFG